LWEGYRPLAHAHPAAQLARRQRAAAGPFSHTVPDDGRSSRLTGPGNDDFDAQHYAVHRST
jgi:hypothetical protein